MGSIIVRAWTSHVFQGKLMMIPQNLPQYHERNANLSQIGRKKHLWPRKGLKCSTTRRNGGENHFHWVFGLKTSLIGLFKAPDVWFGCLGLQHLRFFHISIIKINKKSSITLPIILSCIFGSIDGRDRVTTPFDGPLTNIKHQEALRWSDGAFDGHRLPNCATCHDWWRRNIGHLISCLIKISWSQLYRKQIENSSELDVATMPSRVSEDRRSLLESVIQHLSVRHVT